jgi:predicted RNase H-like HicB family nuclease
MIGEEIIWEDEETLLGPENFRVFVGEKSGHFIIVSSGSPKFCFEANTRVEALEMAKDALEYYRRKI